LERYFEGSSAYKIDDLEFNTRYSKKGLELVKNESSATEVNKRRRQAAKSLCSYLLVVFLLASSVVYTKVLLMQAKTEVSNLEKQYANIVEENTNKKIQMEQSIDLKKIEEIAISQYGMQRLDKNQTIYVKVVQEDYAEIVNEKDNYKEIESYLAKK
jgi:cell division protein FtsL